MFWITPRGLWNLPHCNEVLIVDYMEKNWQKPEDVLTSLLNSPSMRRHLKNVSAFAKSDDSGATLLVHPLLQPPIYLEEDHDNLKFQKTVEARLRECVDTTKQIICHTPPLVFIVSLYQTTM